MVILRIKQIRYKHKFWLKERGAMKPDLLTTPAVSDDAVIFITEKYLDSTPDDIVTNLHGECEIRRQESITSTAF